MFVGLIALQSALSRWLSALRRRHAGGTGDHRSGVLMNLAADDSEGQARLKMFMQGLQKLGWTDGRKTSVPRVARDGLVLHAPKGVAPLTRWGGAQHQ
jgi:hypothetical protein